VHDHFSVALRQDVHIQVGDHRWSRTGDNNDIINIALCLSTIMNTTEVSSPSRRSPININTERFVYLLRSFQNDTVRANPYARDS
jgi:hypothetical protein